MNEKNQGGEIVAGLRNLKEQFEQIAAKHPNDQPRYENGVRPFGTGDLRHFIETLDGALSALPSEQPEPVAWRYRYPNDPTWQLTLDEKQARDKTGETQPLYAQPSKQTGGGGAEDKALIERLCTAMQDGVGCTPWESQSWDRDDGVSRGLVRDSVRRVLAALSTNEVVK
jgi:hypothetical protein